MEFPRMVRVTQEFDRSALASPGAAVHAELQRIGIGSLVRPGARIAITAGSRGIRHNVTMLSAIVQTVKAAGGNPFLVAAMGSHGGGTTRGQLDILTSLGVTESAVGCPVMATDEAVAVGETDEGYQVYCDALAWRADGIVLFNRIKPHTSFRGPNESGLLKMAAVGLGKAPGATQAHRLGPDQMAHAIVSIARSLLQKAPILCGIAVVENSFDETVKVVGLLPAAMEDGDARLLLEAKAYLPKIPVQGIDLLLVEQMGKNYSGTGMDTNVIGRMRIAGVTEPEAPAIQRIVVLDLSDESHGNATGIGLADFTTERLERKMDRHATYLNCVTSTYIQRAFLPIVAGTDREAIELAIRSLGWTDGTHGRVVWIRNTLELSELWVSEGVAAELRGRPGLRVDDETFVLQFDGEGALQQGGVVE